MPISSNRSNVLVICATSFRSKHQLYDVAKRHQHSTNKSMSVLMMKMSCQCYWWQCHVSVNDDMDLYRLIVEALIKSLSTTIHTNVSKDDAVLGRGDLHIGLDVTEVVASESHWHRFLHQFEIPCGRARSKFIQNMKPFVLMKASDIHLTSDHLI